MIDANLVHSLTHHTRRKEQAMGLDFDSELVSALYGCLQDLATEEAVKQAFATELKTRIDTGKNRMKQIMMIVKSTTNKKPLLNEAMTIQGELELATKMLEVLNG